MFRNQSDIPKAQFGVVTFIWVGCSHGERGAPKIPKQRKHLTNISLYLHQGHEKLGKYHTLAGRGNFLFQV